MKTYVFTNLFKNNSTSDEEIFTALTQVGLAGEKMCLAQLSAGQQRRVALARLWLSKQILWILDEPLTAIDKQGVKVLEALFAQHADNGGIVMLTTHQEICLLTALNLEKIKLGD